MNKPVSVLFRGLAAILFDLFFYEHRDPKERSFIRLEVLGWIFVSIIGFVITRINIIGQINRQSEENGAVLTNTPDTALTSILLPLIIIIPILFRLIFGMLPFQAARKPEVLGSQIKELLRITAHEGVGQQPINVQINTTQNTVSQIEETVNLPKDIVIDGNDTVTDESTFLKVIESLKSKPQTPHDALQELAESSRRLSEKIYTRAGAYLFIGGLIAIGGVIYFAQTAPTIPKNATLVDMVALLGPRFGIVFFIEVIAFFFLRQHRDAMDEFRYYESIKRQREENLALFVLASTKWTENGLDVEKFGNGSARGVVLI